jgi:hypothetical protein
MNLHLLHERNAYMAGRVLELAREAPSGRVLVVVGSAQVPGLLYALHHAGCTPAAGHAGRAGRRGGVPGGVAAMGQRDGVPGGVAACRAAGRGHGAA